MFHYFLAHIACHMGRCLPQQTRCRLLIIELFIGLTLLTTQIYVLLRPSSSRYCNQPLLNNLVCQISFMFGSIGFTLILTLMDHISSGLTVAFHLFGIGSLLGGVCTAVFTALASQCANTTPELYCLSLALSVVNTGFAALFVVLAPFWLANIVKPGMVLNIPHRTGLCYQPVSCCTCLWHI